MKTATIDYEDYEVLLGAAIAAVGLTESVLDKATGEQKAAAESSVAQIRASIERAVRNLTVGVRAPSFQDTLTAMIANAQANR